jgi:integrase
MATAHGEPAGRRAGLLEKLMGAVRPEFRAEVLVFDPQDPVFGNPPCRVAGCLRPVHSGRLCEGHHLRWAAAGRPDPDRFAATTDAGWYGRRPLPPCQAAGCGFGAFSHGLCHRHARAWQRAGRPDPQPWIARLPETPATDPPLACVIFSCDLWAHGDIPLCYHHGRRWKTAACPDLQEYARASAEEPCHDNVTIDLRVLSNQLRLELQYALQCRRDDHKAKVSPRTVRRVVATVAGSGAGSLLDWPEPMWRQRFTSHHGNHVQSVLIQARQQVEDLALGQGWASEYQRDVWRLKVLRADTGNGAWARLRFDRISQPWLRDLAKQWLRWRLISGLGPSQAYRSVAAITHFSGFLGSPAAGAGELHQIDRAVLERYLAEMATGLADKKKTLRDYIGLLNGFFTAIRRHGWDHSLPATAMFFTEDYPELPKMLPRYLAEHVMAQLEDPANLSRWDNPAYQLLTIILMRCGLRVSDAARLPFTCIISDAGGAPYLRYHNHKMNRESLVPIDEELHQMILQQQRRVLSDWPGGVAHLFPRPTANLDGSRPLSSGTYREALSRWLERCDIRDEHAQPVHLVPHQWRHTLGTRLINRDVPQHVVQKILDHDSAEMTAHYARLHDTTVRRHWEAARKVNVQGETVTLDPDPALAQAAWAKQRLSRATQALPNGYCGLPIQQSCPHANSCLTCPVFVTTAEFLPHHRTQHQQTLHIISAAEARGQTRLAEMNRQVAGNLQKIITTLEDAATTGGGSDQQAASDAC